LRDHDILAGVAAVAARHLDWHEPLSPEMRLLEDLRLDSIRLLTLAVEVENHFRVCLDETDDAGIVTVADLVAAVRRKLPGG
jgi:acyl carrier protein